MAAVQREFNHTYILHGCGGLTIVQSRLAEHGTFHSILWDPGPPEWRLHFLTDLQFNELTSLLEDVRVHFVIRLYLDETTSAKWLAHQND